MKKEIAYWQMAGFAFTGIVGTFLHFLFDLTGGSLPAALVSAVNDSIWEHLKLLFYPMFLFAIGEYLFWGKEIPGFWWVKLAGAALGIVLIPVLYYTYSGIFGVSWDFINIAIFFFAAGVVFWVETVLFQRGISCPGKKAWALALLAGMAVIFTVLTFCPFRIPLFQDPVTGTFGFLVKK